MVVWLREAIPTHPHPPTHTHELTTNTLIQRATASNSPTAFTLVQVADFSNNQIEELGDLSGHRALRELNLSSILSCSVMSVNQFSSGRGELYVLGDPSVCPGVHFALLTRQCKGDNGRSCVNQSLADLTTASGAVNTRRQ